MLTAEEITRVLARPPVFSRAHLRELELAGIGLAAERDRLGYKLASRSQASKCPELVKQHDHCCHLYQRLQAREAQVRTALDTPDALAAELARQVAIKTQDPFQFH